MTMHFRSLAAQAFENGAISAEDILALRRAGWSDGKIDIEEAEAIFVINDQLMEPSSEWSDFFVESICEFILIASTPRGYVNAGQAEWLIGRIDRDGRLDSMTELELLERLFERAVSVPARLQAYALAQIEKAVLTGAGPTRDGAALDPGNITEAECRLLRRFVFAPAGERPAAVGKGEAEALFRIKDAALGKTTDPAWKLLFVQGVGNYLQGFAKAQHSPERAAELESFMNDGSASLGKFFGRMARSDVGKTFAGLLRRAAVNPDTEDEVAEAGEVTGDEQLWLRGRLDDNGKIDEFEQALLDFLAEG